MTRWSSQQQKAFVSNGVVCPKPRKVGAPLHFHEPMITPSRLLHISNQQGEVYDPKAGMELMDIIRMKGSCGRERSNFQVASSPPFFAGSPPSRVSNPVIQDEQFGNDKSSPLSSPRSSSRKSGRRGCVRVGFGTKPITSPARRIEGFDCRGNCSVSALA